MHYWMDDDDLIHQVQVTRTYENKCSMCTITCLVLCLHYHQEYAVDDTQNLNIASKNGKVLCVL